MSRNVLLCLECGSSTMKFLRSEAHRGELVMSQGDRTSEWLTMSLDLSMPLLVGGFLYFSGEVALIAFGVIFTAGLVAIRVQDRIAQRPSKIIVDPNGVTRELFWTGRKEHLTFSEITMVKRYEEWVHPRVWYRIESAAGMRWTLTRDRRTEEFDQCFAFINEMWTHLKACP